MPARSLFVITMHHSIRCRERFHLICWEGWSKRHWRDQGGGKPGRKENQGGGKPGRKENQGGGKPRPYPITEVVFRFAA
jgi:hypothetical protein